MRLLLLPVAPLLLAAGGCKEQTAALPEDPVALAQALGEFRIETSFPWNPDSAGFTWYYSPKDLEALNAGRILLGYPDLVPGPNCGSTGRCSYEGGVGKDWVQPLPKVRPYFNAAPTLLPLVYALPDGDFRLDQYLRVYGRWYRFTARARVFLRDGGRRFGVETFPVEAYPLPELPEIYPYDALPPVTVGAVCAQPGGLNDADRWAVGNDAPYYLWSERNAIQSVYYEDGRLISSIFREPVNGYYRNCQLCATKSAVPPGKDFYYDIFVRLVNTEPRLARTYGLWWRVYNKRPLRVEQNPDGTYTCLNFSRENLNAYEGPFTLEELRARYFDPENPPTAALWPR